MFSQPKPEEKPYSLSANKQRFLSLANHDSHYLKAKDLPALIAHYEKKHNIKIYMNGTSPFGKAQLQQNQDVIQRFIDRLKDPQTKYFDFFSAHWVAKNYHMANLDTYAISSMLLTPFYDVYDEIHSRIKPFLDKNGWILQNVMPEQERRLNDVCASLSCKDLIDKNIKKYIKSKKYDMDNLCLDKDQAIEEIKNIQSQLKPGELVGYIYTNNTRTIEKHFEAVIISNSNIFKPIYWMSSNEKCITNDDFPNMPMCSTLPLILENSVKHNAQGGGIECGTMGLSYLKELLKESAKQFKEFCMSLPYYDPWGTLKYFFFPSPQVLRYSQSSLFNKALLAALEPTDKDIEITHKNNIYKIKTFQNMLNETINHAYVKVTDSQQATHLLQILPEFRKRWIAEYEKMEKKRNLMDGDPYNLYLAYKTNQMQKLVKKHSEEKAESYKPLTI